MSEKIHDREFSEWRVSLVGSERLCIFKTVVKAIRPCTWWKILRIRPRVRMKVLTVMKVLCGVYVFSNSPNNTQDCVMCTRNIQRTLKHVLFECTGMNYIRDKYVCELGKYGIDIKHGDDDVLRALLGDDEFWEVYDEINRVDGLCASANFVDEVIVRWNECYTSCNEHI